MATGAMSYAFITALRKKPQQTYKELLQNIRSELQGKYSQKPQLSCSHPLGERGFQCFYVFSFVLPFLYFSAALKKLSRFAIC